MRPLWSLLQDVHVFLCKVEAHQFVQSLLWAIAATKEKMHARWYQLSHIWLPLARGHSPASQLTLHMFMFARWLLRSSLAATLTQQQLRFSFTLTHHAPNSVCWLLISCSVCWLAYAQWSPAQLTVCLLMLTLHCSACSTAVHMIFGAWKFGINRHFSSQISSYQAWSFGIPVKLEDFFNSFPHSAYPEECFAAFPGNMPNMAPWWHEFG